MTPLSEYSELDAAFAAGGALSQVLPHFSQRLGQLEYARKVASAIANREVLIAEAGTGTGKTIAYLIAALMYADRVIITTATRNLQDQLYRKDLEVVRKALGVAAKVALLKGRSNYLCQHRMEQAVTEGQFQSRATVKDLQTIVKFSKLTQTGDLAQVQGVNEQSAVWPWITSTRDNCLGQDCPRYRECFVMLARRKAMEADIVVTNHHLFFADLTLRDEGVAELLPNSDAVIFDEAHQVPITATQFLGARPSLYQAQDIAQDLLAAGLTYANGSHPWAQTSQALGNSARDVRLALPQHGQRLKHEAAIASKEFVQALDALQKQCADTVALLEPFQQVAVDFARITERLQEFSAQLLDWQQSQNENSVRWLDLTHRNATLVSAPLSVAEHLTPMLLQPGRAWVFTSATLSAGGHFKYFAAELGLGHEDLRPKVRTLMVPSPFDYSKQAMLLVPNHLALPAQAEFTQQVAELAAELIPCNHGGSMVLTTTLRAVEKIAEILRNQLPEDYQVLEQGSESNPMLLARFASRKNMVLVGSHSFWEGVDMVGDLLTLVIIDKLPFAPPDDPLVEARSKLLEKNGKNGFRDYSLPQAALTLKQGVGRLIRGEQDSGVLVVCDRRLTQTGWGKTILQSLPPFRLTQDLTEVKEFLSNQAQEKLQKFAQ